MTSSTTDLHEAADLLSARARDRHRASVSLQEELEAIDWYDQRIEACTDPDLAQVLAHNRDEEKEHAAMLLEWLRRDDAHLDTCLRRYLFTEGPITEIEEAVDGLDVRADSSLGIGRQLAKEVL